jgi:hypothetical protein
VEGGLNNNHKSSYIIEMKKKLNSTVYLAALTHYLPAGFEPFYSFWDTNIHEYLE